MLLKLDVDFFIVDAEPFISAPEKISPVHAGNGLLDGKESAFGIEFAHLILTFSSKLNCCLMPPALSVAEQ